MITLKTIKAHIDLHEIPVTVTKRGLFTYWIEEENGNWGSLCSGKEALALIRGYDMARKFDHRS